VVVRFQPDVIQTLRQREVGVGFRVRARIFTDQKTDALVVPRSALFRGADGGWQVFAIVARQVNLQPVNVGLINDEIAEIVSGLQDDQLVVLAPDSRLTHGTRVKPIVRDDARQ
jgi:HlyD family secretion protein